VFVTVCSRTNEFRDGVAMFELWKAISYYFSHLCVINT